MISFLRYSLSVLFLFSFYISFTSCKTEQVLVAKNLTVLKDTSLEIKAFSHGDINKLLEKHKVNGVSIAYINYDKRGWSKGYGFADAEHTQAIDAKTQFQLGSLSQLYGAMAAIDLTQLQLLDLDQDLREKLEKFGIENQFPNTILSLRNLIKNRSGINYPKLNGYKKGEELPTLEQIIQGEAPANNEAIQVVAEPYKTSTYSEGAYVVLEQLINDVLKNRSNPAPFAEMIEYKFIKNLKLESTSMIHPLDTNKVAYGHTAKGEQLEGKYFTYPEIAAGGMWSTPKDLARLAFELGSYPTQMNKLLGKEKAEQLIDEGMGVNFNREMNTFSRYGNNDGYSGLFTFSLDYINGLVILCNSENGRPLIDDILKLANQQIQDQ